jgi:hypothetical protein
MNTSSTPDPHDVEPTTYFSRERARLRKERPPWTDENAVVGLVIDVQHLNEAEDFERYDDAYEDGSIDLLFQPLTPEQIDRRVCDEARRGNFEPLADRIRWLASEHGTGERRSVTLSKEPWDLIVDCLPLGKRQRGRPRRIEEERSFVTLSKEVQDMIVGHLPLGKSQRGRPPMTEDERRTATTTRRCGHGTRNPSDSPALLS